jgi:c-di-GMP-binding flagellar brake protein YcgR
MRRSGRPGLHEGLAVLVEGELDDGALIRLRGRIDVIAIGSHLWLMLDQLVVGGPTLTAGQLVSMSFARADDASYQASVRVLELDERLARLCVSFPGELHRHQARAHVRVTAPLLASIAAAGPRPLHASSQWTEIRTVDVSAGGFSCDLATPLDAGTLVLTTIVVPTRSGDVELEARGTVLRRARSEDGQWRHGIRFLDLGRKTEDELVGALLWLETHRPAS